MREGLRGGVPAGRNSKCKGSGGDEISVFQEWAGGEQWVQCQPGLGGPCRSCSPCEDFGFYFESGRKSLEGLEQRMNEV